MVKKKYYEDNKEAIKKAKKNKYINLTEEEKELKRQYSKNRCNELKQQYKGLVNRHWCLMILKSIKKIFMLLRKQFL